MKNYDKLYIIKGFQHNNCCNDDMDIPVFFKIGAPFIFKNISVGFRIIKTL